MTCTIISMLPVMRDNGQLTENGKPVWHFNVDVIINEHIYSGLYQWAITDGDNQSIVTNCQMLVDYYTQQDVELYTIKPRV